MRFQAEVLSSGKNTTGIEVPAEIVDALGAGKRPKVCVTIGAYSYRTSIASMGGVSMLSVSAEVRAGAGIAAGDEVDVELALDTEPREVTVPPDLAAALDADSSVRATFDRLSYSTRRRLVEPIEGAKTDETRQRRIAKVIDQMRAEKE